MPYLICIVVGIIAGTINVLAGGGSFITLPILIFLGLPAVDANGTNRLAVIAQCISGIWGFHRAGVIEWRWALAVLAPVVIGSAFGVFASLAIPDFLFRRILSLIMLLIAPLAISYRWPIASQAKPLKSPKSWKMSVIFFGVGLYGGFLQAGVGFLSLAATSVAGLDLIRGNGVKLLNVLALTSLALSAFAGTGHVNWGLGLALSIGTVTGALIGVRLTILAGHRGLKRIVITTIIVFAILLWIIE